MRGQATFPQVSSRVSKYFTNEQNRSLISLINMKQSKKAIFEFNSYRANGLRPTQITYSKLVHAFSQKGFLREAENIFNSMEDDGHSPNIIVYSTLINGFVTNSQMTKARGTFDRMRNNGIPSNALIYNTLIRGYSHSKNMKQAEETLQLMRSENIAPDIFTYNILINGYSRMGNLKMSIYHADKIKDENIAWDVYTYSALIRGYSRYGDITKCLELLDRMEEEGTRANIVVFSTIINACANMNQMERAEKLIQCMIQNNIQPNFKTYSALVFGYANHGNFEKAWEAYHSLLENGFSPDTILFSSMINACANCKRMNDVTEVLNKMKEHNIEPTPLIWNTIAGGYASVGELDECINIIRMSTKLHRPVSLKALNPLLKFYVENQKITDARTLLRNMKKRYHCTPDISSFNVVIKGLAMTGNVEAMMDLFYEMKDHSVLPSSMTIIHLFFGITKDCTDSDLLIGNIEALLSCAKESRIYINRATVSYLLNLISPSKNSEGIELCLELVEYLISFHTPLNENIFAYLHPYVMKEASQEQKNRVNELMQQFKIEESSLAPNQQQQKEMREKQNSFSSSSFSSSSELQTFADTYLFDDFTLGEVAVGIIRELGHEITQQQGEMLIRLFLKQNDVEEAQFEFSALKESGVKPSFELYGLIHTHRESNNK